MVASPDLSVFGKLRSFDDYQRMQEEFEIKKAQQEQAAQLGQLQIQQAQKQMATPDLESLAQQSLYAYHQGQPLSAEGKAALETLATMKGSSVQYKPDAFGNVRAVTEPNPYQQFLGQAGGGPMAASQQAIMQRQSEIGSNPYQGELEVEPMNLADVEQAIGANSPALKMPGSKTDLSRVAFDKQYSPDEILKMPTQDYRALMSGIPDAGPNTQQLAQEEAVKLEAARAAADVSASEKGAGAYATKTAEVEAAKPKKLEALSRVRSNLVEVKKILGKLPQGKIEAGAQYITSDVLGYPSPGSTASAEIDTLLPAMLQDLKQISRDPGEGTFSNVDQQSLEGMVIDKNAPLSSKIAAIKTLDGILQRYEESLGKKTMSTAGPGWGYLGVKQ